MSASIDSISDMDYFAALNQLYSFETTEKIDLKKTSQEAYEKIMEDELRKGVKDLTAVNDLFKLFGIPVTILPHFSKNPERCVNDNTLPMPENDFVLKREEQIDKDAENK